ncbi:Dolichyl-diphosphooligosaccharide--protein glycosyltransferase subunit Swp1 [Schizophyllum amplum]|uniref:Ribophorin II n=1 Tax=Schizophyllum amplum TaxID=97359 RepID=A0A550CFJ6_9AGAR|nr:Dolichyl-diphosphooligosaccharide--protein glycosyltransferase subunit Swp1 [Auriculariopsis ampla]
MLLSSLILSALAALAAASPLTLQSARFTVTSEAGAQLRSEPISLRHKSMAPVTLAQTDNLKIAFQILNKETGEGVQPHQAFLRFYDAESGEEGVQPIRVGSGGKAKFEMNMAKPPASLPPTTTNPLQVSLIIGSYEHSPLKAYIFDLIVPPSQPAPVHPDEASFHLLPEIQHTFRPEQKLPPKFVSFVASFAVLAPWLVLLGLWSQVTPRLPRLASPNILPFTAALGAFEGLLVWYWVDLKLGQVLLYGACLGVVALFAGKHALATIVEGRSGKA